MIENEQDLTQNSNSEEELIPPLIEDSALEAESTEEAEERDEPKIDYETLAKEDLETLKREFPALSAITSLLELEQPERYGELRDLGLSPREAYLATNTLRSEKRSYDNRSHLHSTVPKSHGGRVDAMSISELREVRELFSGMSDSEIVRLYKKVNS